MIYTGAQLTVRYAFQFTFWGEFNEPRGGDFRCEDRYISTGCAPFARVVGIERSDDIPEVYTPTSPLIGPTPLYDFVPDLLLLFFLCVNKIVMQRHGLWR